MPFHKLVEMAVPAAYKPYMPENQRVHLLALSNVIVTRLGEASDEQLVSLYGRNYSLRASIIPLYPLSATVQSLEYLLKWARECPEIEHRNLLAFKAISLGASAHQIERIFDERSERFIDARVFSAYASLPSSSDSVLLRWAKASVNLVTYCQSTLADRGIRAEQFVELVNKSKSFAAYKLYIRAPGADPKQLIDWFVSDSTFDATFLASALLSLNPELEDLCRALETDKHGSMGKLREYAVEYLSKRPRHREAS